MAYVRWRGARAFLLSNDKSPYHDDLVASVLRKVDHLTACYLASEFDVGFADAAAAARELEVEHVAAAARGMRLAKRLMTVAVVNNPELPAPCPSPGRDRGPGMAGHRDRPEPALIPRFRWFGQFAYARGIDRSPWHDSTVRKLLKTHPRDLHVLLLRAWEAGWDEAHGDAEQLMLERRSAFDMPPLVITRWVDKSSGTMSKE